MKKRKEKIYKKETNKSKETKKGEKFMQYTVKKRFNEYIRDISYFIFSNDYYLEIGKKQNLNLILSGLKKYSQKNYKNLSSNNIKINFNDKYLYITYLPSKKFLGIPVKNIKEVSDMLEDIVLGKEVERLV